MGGVVGFGFDAEVFACEVVGFFVFVEVVGVAVDEEEAFLLVFAVEVVCGDEFFVGVVGVVQEVGAVFGGFEHEVVFAASPEFEEPVPEGR